MSEEWKEIEGYPGYEVSNLGSVRNSSTMLIIRPILSPHGYWRVRLNKDKKRIRHS